MWEGAKPAFKLAFAGAWICAQGALIATAGTRPDAAFGFRMFSESSTLQVRLFRRIASPVASPGDGAAAAAIGAEGQGSERAILVPDGDWTATDARGTVRRFSWAARVKEPNLSTFGVTMHAAYGAAAQLQRWRAALEDVAQHIPEDAETRALELEIAVRRNGRAETVTHIVVRR